MAGDAGAACKVVIVVDVAIGALARRHGVQAGQSKAGGGVIECRVGPRRCVMTLLASGREARVRYRRGRVVEIGLVATDAGRIGDVVVVVDVAIGACARRHRVGSGERKSRLGVIESRWLPGRSVVAGLADLGEPAGDVVGIRGALEILQVARDTGVRSQIVIVIDVAISASPRRHRVRAGQREIHRGVIEGRR